MKSIFAAGRKTLAVLMTIPALLIGVSAFAQNTVKGTVVDANGEAIIGAAVMIPGTTTGTITDIDGTFQINVAAGTTIEVSCIGYTTQAVKAANGMKVTLAEDSTLLEETVVIGYGTARVKDLTGSVVTVGQKDLQLPVTNAGEAIMGKMAGVVVTQGNSPGSGPSIRVRGNKSISSSNEPLVLVDGFPGSLSNVPPDMIKSINVLKDAAATAIYGSRGASGVVIVTTKTPNEGTTSVNYSGYIQIKDSSNEIQNVMNTSDYLKFTLGYARDYNESNYVDMLKYFGIGSAYGNHYNDYLNVPIHNWQRDLVKTGVTHSHNLTISTGTKKSRTQFALNYVYDDGTVIESWYRRFNASLKTSQYITDNLNLDLNISYNNSRSHSNNNSGSYTYLPLNGLGPEPTNIAGFGNGSGNMDTLNDPTLSIYRSDPYSIGHNFGAIGSLNWRPIEGLTVRTELQLRGTFSRSEGYNLAYANVKSSASLSRSESNNLNWNTTIQYQIPFKNKNHRADVMVGNEMRMSDGSGMTFSGTNYPSNFDRETTFAFMNEYIDSYNFSTSYSTPGRQVSFFGRANYSFKDRYLFTATVRADGSSNFAPENRWGIFPAGAFAWRISDEPWMSGSKNWLSNLKLRLSYGITGSDSIGANNWRETWSLGGNTTTTISTKRTDTELDYLKTYAPGSRMQNPALKWEETTTANIGLDFGLWNERVYGTIEAYSIKTDGLLMTTPVNAASGYTTQYQNLGTISNKGIELTLNADFVRNSDFTLRGTLILQHNKNNVEYIAESVGTTKYSSWSNSEHYPQGGEYFIREGLPMGQIKVYSYDGWYTVDDFDYDPATQVYTLKSGIPDWGIDSYWSSFNLPKGQKAFPGALKVKDLNENGTIDQEDVYEYGTLTPPLTGSFALSGRWRQFDFTANMGFVLGGHIVNQLKANNLYGSKDNKFGANRLSFVSDCYSPYRWSNGELEFVSDPAELTKMNANAQYWTPSSMVGLLTDKFLESATYFRLRNITIGYTVPSNVVKRMHLQNLRAYVTATNLFTITKYSGLNPDISFGSSTTPGVDGGSYPLSRNFTFGVNITF